MSVRIAGLVWTLALAAAGGTVAVVVGSDHASAKFSILALTVATGLAFVASGLVVRTRRPENRSGLLLIAAGFASFVAALKTADDAMLFSLGHALQWVYFGFLVHVVLAFPSGRVGSSVGRWLVGVGYFLGFAMLPLLMAFGEAHVACDRGPCPDNVLSVDAGHGLASTLERVHSVDRAGRGGGRPGDARRALAAR